MSIASHAAVSVGGQWCRFVIQMGALAILARLLGPSDFGLVAMALAVAGLATLLSDFGFSMATLQAGELTRQQSSNIFWANAVLGVAAAAVVSLSSPIVAGLYGDERTAHLCQALSVMFIAQALVPQFRAEAALRGRYRAIAAADVLGQAVGAASGIVAATHGAGYWAVAVQQIVAAIVTAGGTAASSGWWPSWPRRAEGMRPLFTFGASAGGVQVLTYVSSNADTVLLGRAWGAGTVGLYNQAYQLFRLPLQQLVAPLTLVAVPWLSQHRRDGHLESAFLRAHLGVTYALSITFGLSFAVAEPALQLLLGDGWDGIDVVYRILAVGGLFQAASYAYYWLFLSTATTGVQLRCSAVARVLMIGLLAAGVPWGAEGVAIGSSVGLAVNWLILTTLGIPATGVPRAALVRSALRPVLAASGAAIVAAVATADLEASVSLPAGVLVYAAALGGIAATPPFRPDRSALISALDRKRYARA